MKPAWWRWNPEPYNPALTPPTTLAPTLILWLGTPTPTTGLTLTLTLTNKKGGDTARELLRRAARNTDPLVSLRGLMLGLGLELGLRPGYPNPNVNPLNLTLPLPLTLTDALSRTGPIGAIR